jgi:hypothetical protein
MYKAERKQVVRTLESLRAQAKAEEWKQSKNRLKARENVVLVEYCYFSCAAD